MSKIVLCSEPAAKVCPETFGLRVSGWLDKNNTVNTRQSIKTPPPAGVRLRWHWPFLSADPKGRLGYPKQFVVRRSKGLPERGVFRPVPTAGHLPRTIALSNLWKPMPQASDRYFVVGGGACGTGAAVYFELNPYAHPVEATLTDVRGQIAARAVLQPGDFFYYEVSGFHSLTFSAPPALVKTPIYLQLDVDLDKLDVATTIIAEVDARIWVGKNLKDLSRRLSNPQGESYVTITEADWDPLVAAGKRVIAAHDSGSAAAQPDIDRLIFSSAQKWEVALLMGLGFLDGEHPPGPGYDKIREPEMLSSGGSQIFAYQVEAVMPAGADSWKSSAFFVTPEPMPLLTSPKASVSKPPMAESVLVNSIDIGAKPEEPIRTSLPEEKVRCTVEYKLETTNTFVERLLVTSMASASAITGEAFVSVGEANVWSEPPWVIGFAKTSTSFQDIAIPFYDSEVWIGIAVADYWDRLLDCPRTKGLLPKLTYRAHALALEKATCISPQKRAVLDILPQMDWRADNLARYANGRIEFMARYTDLERLQLEAKVGPAFLYENRSWATIVYPPVPPTEQGILRGGTIEVGSFIARIEGFELTSTGQQACLFEVEEQCAAGSLYKVDSSGNAKAVLIETSESERLWKKVGEVGILADGMVEAYQLAIQLNLVEDPLITSRTFEFATRMAIQFNSQSYHGPISAPVVAPYLHSLPEPPMLCATIQFIGVDYYGRTMLRVEPEDCDWLQVDRQCDVALAEGAVEKQSEFAGNLTKGLFGPQTAFRERVVFESFSILTNAPDGANFTLGISYVRTSDGAESLPLLQRLLAREIDSGI